MKKLLFILLLLPWMTNGQTTGQKVADGIEAASDLLDILNGNDPQANYDSWKTYIGKTYPDYICMMNFSFYKKNNERFCFFSPSKRSIFIYWADGDKKYRIPVIIDDTCQRCKIKGTVTYNDLQTKSLDYDSYSNALSAYRAYVPYLLYNKSYISWLTKLNNRTEPVAIPKN